MAKQSLIRLALAQDTIVRSVLEAVAKEIIVEASYILRTEKAVATRDILKGFGYVFEGSNEVRVFNNRHYSTFLEFGRRPGKFPPPDVIAEWLAARGLPDDDQTVFAVGKHIAENGTVALRFFSRAAEKVLRRKGVKRRMQEEVKAWLSINAGTRARRFKVEL